MFKTNFGNLESIEIWAEFYRKLPHMVSLVPHHKKLYETLG